MIAHTGLNTYVLRRNGEFIYRAGESSVSGYNRDLALCFLVEPEGLDARVVELKERFKLAENVVAMRDKP